MLIEKEKSLRDKVGKDSTYRSGRFMVWVVVVMVMIMVQRLTWQRHHKNVANFIMTKASPPIFYLPKFLDDHTRSLLQEPTKFSRFVKQDFDPEIREEDLEQKPRQHQDANHDQKESEKPAAEEMLEEEQHDEEQPETKKVENVVRERYDATAVVRKGGEAW